MTVLVCVSIPQQNQGEMSQFLPSWAKSVENFALSYQQNAYPADLVPLWSLHSPHPGQSCLVGIRNDPARIQHCLLGGRGEYLSLPGLSRALFFPTSLSKIVASVGACNLIFHIHVGVNWQLSKQGIHCPVSHDHIAGSNVDPLRLIVFLSSLLTSYLSFQLIAGSTEFFAMVSK